MPPTLGDIKKNASLYATRQTSYINNKHIIDSIWYTQ